MSKARIRIEQAVSAWRIVVAVFIMVPAVCVWGIAVVLANAPKWIFKAIDHRQGRVPDVSADETRAAIAGRLHDRLDGTVDRSAEHNHEWN